MVLCALGELCVLKQLDEKTDVGKLANVKVWQKTQNWLVNDRREDGRPEVD